MIDVIGVSRRFGRITAVDGVSFTVRGGEVVGLLGANGAGKSTVIRMILGLLAPTAGRVELFGAAPTRQSRNRIGYVPQGLGLYPDLTVSENLAFVADAFSVERPDLDDELARVASRPVGEISLGLRRRTAFAAALSHRPEALILDEPTSGVGPMGRAELWRTIGEAAEGGAAVLVSTHYMEEAEQCDRIIMLAAGREVARGTTADISAGIPVVEVTADDWAGALAALERAGMRPGLSGRRLRVAGIDPGAVGVVLRDAGVPAAVTPSPARFEEAFVAMVSRR
jgi:ABC-2 type transport system ATP-binding protein